MARDTDRRHVYGEVVTVRDALDLLLNWASIGIDVDFQQACSRHQTAHKIRNPPSPLSDATT
jgi:hypothetical protein